jgi:hypothetical protein
VRLLELFDSDDTLTRNQRWAHILTLIFCATSLMIGLNLRESILYATNEYIDREAGIRVNYPRDWLIDTVDENNEGFVFRARDTSRSGFKTTLQISVHPFTSSMTPINVLHNLSLIRAQTLSNYRVLTTGSVVLPNEETATLHEYVFVSNDMNPFQQSLPIVVEGRDILVIRRGQAVLISFLADVRTYTEDILVFERFLSSLDF